MMRNEEGCIWSPFSSREGGGGCGGDGDKDEEEEEAGYALADSH